jgi:hypothetical protein
MSHRSWPCGYRQEVGWPERGIINKTGVTITRHIYKTSKRPFGTYDAAVLFSGPPQLPLVKMPGRLFMARHNCRTRSSMD